MYNPLFYGSVAVISVVSLGMAFLHIRAALNPKKYKNPDDGASLSIIALMVVSWALVAIYVTSKFITNLKKIENEQGTSSEAAKSILSSTKLARRSMVGFLVLMALQSLAKPLNLNEMWQDIYVDALTDISFFVVIIPFIKAMKAAAQFRNSQTQTMLTTKSKTKSGFGSSSSSGIEDMEL